MITAWHELSRMLSDEGIPTVMSSFKQFEGQFRSYARRTPRPLVVIIFETMDGVYSYGQIVRDLDNGYAVWLIIFMGEASYDVCKYCSNPSGNLLNLRFNSEVIISCCESNIIEEWWSTGSDRCNRLKIARWFDDGRIQWLVDESLYSRRHSMEGQEFRVAAVKVKMVQFLPNLLCWNK